MGRVIATTLPDNTTVNNVFYPNGLVQLTYGSRTYAVGYSYDAQGRVSTMTNWTSFASQAGARVTSWNYDPYRGWLASKTYAGGAAGPTYSNTAAGRLQSRIWARNITTTYGYNTAGDLWTVTSSDGTPSLTNTYDRLGRLATVTQGSGATTTLAYNNANQTLSESYGGTSLLTGFAVTNGYDTCLRRTALALLNSQSSVLALASYGYDAASRLQTLTDAANNSATYSYLANSPLVQQITFKQNGTTRMITTKSYDNLNRQVSIVSTTNSAAVASFGYQYNSANQRTAITNADSSYWVYQYDVMGQVISGAKCWSGGVPVAGEQFQYAFDDIGNRASTHAGGDQWGANLRYATYSANSLNQDIVLIHPIRAIGVGYGRALVGAVVLVTETGHRRRVRRRDDRDLPVQKVILFGRRHPGCAVCLQGNLLHQRRVGKIRIRGGIVAAVADTLEARGGIKPEGLLD